MALHDLWPSVTCVLLSDSYIAVIVIVQLQCAQSMVTCASKFPGPNSPLSIFSYSSQERKKYLIALHLEKKKLTACHTGKKNV